MGLDETEAKVAVDIFCKKTTTTQKKRGRNGERATCFGLVTTPFRTVVLITEATEP
jgi:hypothetical protein